MTGRNMEWRTTGQGSIKVILFDLGNVILPFQHFQIAEKLSRFSRKKEFQDPSRLFSEIFDLENGLVNLYETGRFSTEEFFETLKTLFGLSLSFADFIPIWNEIFTENREVTALIRSLQGRKRLGLLSNTNPLHFQYALERFPVIRLFDRFILSYEVGFKKPAFEIFEAAMGWADTPPEEILFIDDTRGHVEAARRLGLQAIHFTPATRLQGLLDDLDLDQIGRSGDTDGNASDDDHAIPS